MRYSSSDPQRLRHLVERDGLLLGTHSGTGRRVHLSLERLTTGIHMIGPSGSGKTRVLLAVIEQLAVLDASLFIFNPKGSLGAMVRDFCIHQGLVGRLRVFDPSDPDLLPGFNPLRPNGLPSATQAKAVRDAILAGHGQTDFDNTQQLARHLLLALYVARELCLTLVEAASILRSGSRLRPQVLRELADPVVRDALDHFHRLRPERQDQLAASTLARLETATSDPLLRRILTQPNGLDVGELIKQRNIFVADIRQFQPLRPADVKFLGRLLLNDILAHVFARSEQPPTPVYVIIDEAELFATEDLCRAFDQGRELGLRTVIAHQHFEQLMLEGGDRRLRVSVDTDLRTKIVFGGLPVSQLEDVVPDLFLDQFDPLAVKAELTSLECEPVETVRSVLATSTSRGRSETSGTSETTGEGDATALCRGEALTTMHGTAHASGHVDSAFAGQSTTVLPTGEVVISDATSGGSGVSDVRSESMVYGATESESLTETRSTSQTRGTSESIGTNSSSSTTVTLQPFHEYRKRRVPSTRWYWTREEFLTERIKAMRLLPQASFVLKVPTKSAVHVRAPFVAEPCVGAAQVAAARARLASLLPRLRPDIPNPTDARLLEYRHIPDGTDDHTTTVPRRRAARRRP